MARDRIWLGSARLWAPALVFFLINGLLLLLFQLFYAGRAEARAAGVDQLGVTLRKVETTRAALEEQVGNAVSSRDRIDLFYSDWLGSEGARLTAVLAEIKRLARQAGLEPSSIRYDTEAIEELGVVKRLIAFTVEGTYVELRRLINLLELTDSFVLLEQVGLSEQTQRGGQQGSLRITLRLASYFVSEALEAAESDQEIAG